MPPSGRRRRSNVNGASARAKRSTSTSEDKSPVAGNHRGGKLSKVTNGKGKTGDIARRAKFQAWHQQQMSKLSAGSRKEGENGQDGELSKETSASQKAVSVLSPLLMLCLSTTPNKLSISTTNKSFESTRPASSGSSHSSCAASVDTSNDGSNLNESASSQGTRHNDASFYPYIRCVLCDQWICSRNRFIHIESHLQYRPYKCSLCDYSNRKEIFIQIHLRKHHKGENGQPLFLPSEDIEKRVWELADQSLQHTSRVIRTESVQSAVDSNTPTSQISNDRSNRPEKNVCEGEGIVKPLVANAKRRANSHISLHVLPKENEEQCTTCGYYIQKNLFALGDHVRCHVPKAAYRCAEKGCLVSHFSRTFVYKHMKESHHQLRERVQDPLSGDHSLLEQFLSTCRNCFPSFYTVARLDRIKNRYLCNSYCVKNGEFASSSSFGKKELKTKDSDVWQTDCIGCTKNLRLLGTDYRNGCCCCFNEEKCSSGAVGKVVCRLCLKSVPGKLIVLEGHALSHVVPLPLKCCHCSFAGSKLSALRSHISETHKYAHQKRIEFLWDGFNWKSLWKRCFERCFNYLATFSAELPRVTCALCFEEVVDSPATMLDHTQHHISVRKYGCIYCPTTSTNEAKTIAAHIQQYHCCCPLVVQCFYDSQETSSERLRVCQVCFPGFKL
ncbi:hypothetical protein M514_10621 [Trichuris suis]|uniref:C2H2-type domain-containing protein n=1 Tax=Trichuris suis TaxID=68888 RepID=A0A085NJR0_9BILA|nr:hypothetical protein M514_10621 [Trichuris suis]